MEHTTPNKFELLLEGKLKAHRLELIKDRVIPNNPNLQGAIMRIQAYHDMTDILSLGISWSSSSVVISPTSSVEDLTDWKRNFRELFDTHIPYGSDRLQKVLNVITDKAVELKNAKS